MEAFFKDILVYFLNFISRYSFFLNWDYYDNLFSKYFSVGGFVAGFIFVILVYGLGDAEQKKAGFFKVLAIIAVINSCSVLMNFINAPFYYNLFDYQGLFYYTGINTPEAMINAPDNIISGFILTLVISSCYRQFGGRAFVFGIATHAALPLLNFSCLESINNKIPIWHMIVRVVLIGFVCLIMSYRKYFFTSWIWYFGFHMLIRGILFFPSVRMSNCFEVSGILESFSRFISYFTIDILIFIVILAIAIIFEKGVLTVRTTQETD